MPDGTRCSAHDTAPLPQQSISTPVMVASRHCGGCRPWRSAQKRPRVENHSRDGEPRPNHHERRNRLDGVADCQVGRSPDDVHGHECGENPYARVVARSRGPATEVIRDAFASRVGAARVVRRRKDVSTALKQWFR